MSVKIILFFSKQIYKETTNIWCVRSSTLDWRPKGYQLNPEQSKETIFTHPTRTFPKNFSKQRPTSKTTFRNSNPNHPSHLHKTAKYRPHRMRDCKTEKVNDDTIPALERQTTMAFQKRHHDCTNTLQPAARTMLGYRNLRRQPLSIRNNMQRRHVGGYWWHCFRAFSHNGVRGACAFAPFRRVVDLRRLTVKWLKFRSSTVECTPRRWIYNFYAR